MKKFIKNISRQFLLLSVVVGALSMLTTTAFAANKSIDTVGTLKVTPAINDASYTWTGTAVAVTDDDTTPTITAANNARLIIPDAATNMFFDNTNTSISITSTAFAKIEVSEGGAACGASPCTVTVTYAQSDGTTACTSDCKVMIIPIGVNFAAGDQFSVDSGEIITINHDTAFSAQGLGLGVAGNATIASDCGVGGNLACNTQALVVGSSLNVGAPTITATAANHIYAVNQADKIITSGITIAEDGSTAVLNTTSDVHIVLPGATGVGLSFVAEDTSITCTDVAGTTPCLDHFNAATGSANALTGVTFKQSDGSTACTTAAGDCKVMIIPVNANTDQGTESVTFTAFTVQVGTVAAAASIQLEVSSDYNGTHTDATGANVTIGAPTVAGSLSQTFYTGMNRQPLESTFTITESATAPGISALNNLILKIPSTLNLLFDPTDTSITLTDSTGTPLADGRITGCAESGGSCTITPSYKAIDGTTACTESGLDCKTLVIPVASDFVASEAFSISGLTLYEFSATSDADAIEIEAAGVGNFGSSATDEDSATTIEILVATSSQSKDKTPPAVPTGLAASVNANGQVVLTWNDPSDTDLSTIQILKGISPVPISGDAFASVAKGKKTYTDATVKAGQKITYAVRSKDAAGNLSAMSSSVTLTITANADPVVTTTTDTTTTTTDTTTTTTTTTSSFSDLPADHWATAAVVKLAAKGIVKGNEDGSFNPAGNLNRAEAAAFVHRAIGLAEPTAPSAKPYGDVATSAWYAGYVNGLKGLGILNASKANYNPAGQMNRAEFIQMVMEAYYYYTGKTMGDAAGTSAFADVAKSQWYYNVVLLAEQAGYVKGSACTSGTGTCFRPSSSINRAEVVVILDRVFGDTL